MKKFFTFLITVVMTLTVFSGCGHTKAPESFSVGYAKKSITPEFSVLLGGFVDVAERYSTAVLDPIYATCVAFTDTAGTTALFFSMDLLSIEESMFNEIRNKISENTGVPVSNIMFTASHTHSSPVQRFVDVESVVESNKLIVEACLQLAEDALADRSPAQMYATFARPEGMSFVRHYLFDDGSYMGKRIGYQQKKLIGHQHKADNLLQAVKFTRKSGKDILLVNWQTHYFGATDINHNAISADYPGILRDELEQQLNCHVSFILGGAGNLVSSSVIQSLNKYKNYKEYGKALAAEVVAAADSFAPAELGNIRIQEFEFTSGGWKLPLYAIGFGDFACAFAPFEIFDTNAMAVREASKFKYTFYASCSNASSNTRYLPDEPSFAYPTYEVLGHEEQDKDFTLFPKGTAEIIQRKLIDMLNTVFAAGGGEEKAKDEGYLSSPFAPVSDGVEYTNYTPGNIGACMEVDNGLYRIALFVNGASKNMLAASKEVAEQVLSKSNMKLLFDERNVIVGIAE